MGVCKSCNIYVYNRKCDLVRHIKKCDIECSTYVEYEIKYTHGGMLPKCDCGNSEVKVSYKGIERLCAECIKIEYVNKLSKLAIDRFNDPKLKHIIFEKRKKTNLIKYGMEYASQSNTVKDKTILSNINKYGTPNTLQLPQVITARINSFVNNFEEINNKRKLAWDAELILKSSLNRQCTLLKKYGVNFCTQIEHVRKNISNLAKLRYSDPMYKIKMQKIIEDRYGVISVSQLPYIQEKIKKTCLEKYDSEYYLGSLTRRRKMEEQGNWLPLSEISEFRQYHRKCIQVTNKHKKYLFNRWDGNCYYTKIKLLNNSANYNDALYRTIDHIIPIYVGYITNTDPLVIGDISNLCICSRSFNSFKNNRNLVHEN